MDDQYFLVPTKAEQIAPELLSMFRLELQALQKKQFQNWPIKHYPIPPGRELMFYNLIFQALESALFKLHPEHKPPDPLSAFILVAYPPFNAD